MPYDNNVLLCLIFLTILSLVISSCQNNVYIDEEFSEEDEKSTTDTDSHVHDFYYEHNETEHWLNCSICGAEKDLEDHVLDWLYDDTGHWLGCNICGYNNYVKEGKTAHVFDNENDDTCNICTYNRAQKSGFVLTLIDKDPKYKISDPYRNGDFLVFTLTPQYDSESEPETIAWEVFYFDDNFEEQVISTSTNNDYSFSFEATLITDFLKGRLVCVMCTYSNEYGTFSDTFEKFGYEYSKIGGTS